MTEGRKDDEGKTRYDLIPVIPLDLLARVYMHGAEKYGDHNWRKGIKYSRIYSAVMRHLQAWKNMEDNDIESSLPHLAHAAWGLFTLMEYMTYNQNWEGMEDLDDREWGLGNKEE